MVFKEVGKEFLSCVTAELSSGDDSVVLQVFCISHLRFFKIYSHAMYLFPRHPLYSPICRMTFEQQDLILSYFNVLSALQVCLSEAKADVRGPIRPAVSSLLELVSKNPRRKKAMIEAEIVSHDTLKRLCE